MWCGVVFVSYKLCMHVKVQGGQIELRIWRWRLNRLVDELLVDCLCFEFVVRD